jgi:N-acetylmuramoyl-L-alanine amidase
VVKICVDPGHGGPDSGAFKSPFYEKDIVLAVGLMLRDELHARDCDVVMTRDSDVFIPLSERARMANHERCNFFISLHCNADPDADGPQDREARGSEVFFYQGSVTGEALATRIGKALGKVFPPYRGTKATSSLLVLRKTAMPGVLVELGFIDSQDAVRLADPSVQQSLAKLLASALLFSSAR